MLDVLKNFRDGEDGTVTVDWVVLTGTMVALGIVLVVGVSAGVSDFSDGLDAAYSPAASVSSLSAGSYGF